MRVEIAFETDKSSFLSRETLQIYRDEQTPTVSSNEA